MTDAILDDGTGVVPTHRTRYRKLSARNAQIGSKDAQLQTRIINEKAAEQYGDKWFLKPTPAAPVITLKPGLNNHFSDLENLETHLIQQLQQAPVENTIARSASGGTVDPNNVFVKPHEGNSARTRLMGDFVLKGYESQNQAEVEWVGTKLMQFSGENTPDIRLASMELRKDIMAVDPDYKQPDITKSTFNPRCMEPGQPIAITETIPVEDPQHCLVMPKVFGANIGNIIEDPKLRSSLKKNMDVHIRELSRIAFKDIILGNSDRILRMYTGLLDPPYLPTLEEIQGSGSPMNLGNVMFQTVEGEVIAHSAIAIDNYGHSTNDLSSAEGQQQELTAFEFFLHDVEDTVKRSPGEVLQEQHIISLIVRSLRKGMEPNPLSPEESLFTMSEEEMVSLVKEGVLQGWGQMHENMDYMQHFLNTAFNEEEEKPTEQTLAYTNTVSKKLEILRRTLKPTL